MSQAPKRLTDRRFLIGFMVAVLLPVCGLFWYSAADAIEKWHVSERMEALRDLVELSSRVTRVVHELQMERGSSAGYLGSEGLELADRLRLRRARSEIALATLLEAASELDFSAYEDALEPER